MRVPLAIAAALAIVLGGVVVTLSRSEPRLTGSNAQVERSGVNVSVPPQGGIRCQDGEYVPAGTERLRLFLDTLTRPAVDVTIASGGRPGRPPRVVARGELRAPIGTGSQTVTVSPRFRSELASARVCLRNRGASAVSFSGNKTPRLDSGANIYGTRLDDDARIDYLYPRNRTWWSDAGAVARRFGLVKTTFFGAWTMWAMFAVVALLWGAVVVLLLRVLPRS